MFRFKHIKYNCYLVTLSLDVISRRLDKLLYKFVMQTLFCIII